MVRMHKKQQMAVHEVKTHGSSSSSGQRSTTEIYKLFSKDHSKKKTSVSSCSSIFEQWIGGGRGAMESANRERGNADA